MIARHIAANSVNFLIICFVVLAGSIYWANKQYQIDGPLKSDVNFEVKKGDRFRVVSADLEKLGIIKNDVIFNVWARYLEQDDKLKFGNYLIPSGSSMQQVVSLITSGKGINEQITFPEGFTSYQIVERLKANSNLIGDIVILPVEGSLAPNTYSYQNGDSRRDILKKMSDMQNEILNKAWKLRSNELPYKNKIEAIIIASIIEKETSQINEMKLISGVIMNRLKSGIPLGMDSTIVYDFTNGNPQNMRSIRQSDLDKNSKYNTRRFLGLPPSAIANPGKLAIQAALNPDKTDFLYFVADGTGGHVFSKTLKEHNRNVANWRKIENKRKKSDN
ncbi:endolytic transglycosylase MltG [Amylibacter sp.]|nr:endolytic transglycosylase MltG [Amylibacter sp.]